MKNEIVQEILDEYDRLKMGQKLHEDYENLMDKLREELNRELDEDEFKRTRAEEHERAFLERVNKLFY